MPSTSVQTLALIVGLAAVGCGGDVEQTGPLDNGLGASPSGSGSANGDPSLGAPSGSGSSTVTPAQPPTPSAPPANPPAVNPGAAGAGPNAVNPPTPTTAAPATPPSPANTPVEVTPVDPPPNGGMGNSPNTGGMNGQTPVDPTPAPTMPNPNPVFPGFPPFNMGGMGNGGTPVGMGGSPTAGGSGPTMSGGGSGGSVTPELDCNAAMPTQGAQQHSGNSQGGSGNLAWQIWSNVGTGSMTTYSVPAFTASWQDSGDYLGRIGFEWGNNGGSYESHGEITAQFAATKSGSGGQYSYIGMYGWTTDPCVEWYIVDDSYNNMPVNPGNTTNKGTVDLDDGSYIMYTRNTTGTGGSRCSGVSNWVQYYSIRTSARDCGTISLTKHFQAWESLGMTMGNLLEAKILVEVGGGTGHVDFPVANVMTTQ